MVVAGVGSVSVSSVAPATSDRQEPAAEPAHPEERHRDVEALARADAPRRRGPAAVAPRAPPWVWITPLGVPRLPDVNRIARSSAGRTAGLDARRPVHRATSLRAVTRRSSRWRRFGRRAVAPAPADDRRRGRRRARRARRGSGGRGTRAGDQERRHARGPELRLELGGRSSVLSGTSTAPMRITAIAVDSPVDAVRHEQPDAACPCRPRPRGAGGPQRSAACVELGVGEHRRRRAPSPRHRPVASAGPDQAGRGGVGESIDGDGRTPVSDHRACSFSARASSLPLDIIGTSASGTDDDDLRDLVGRQRPGQAARSSSRSIRVEHRRRRRAPRPRPPPAGRRPRRRPRSRGTADPLSVGDRGLDLPRRHVGAPGLDHVAAAALEVEEPVGVDRDEVAGAEPAVGVERLGSRRARSSPPSGTARGTRARRSRRRAHGAPVSGSRTRASKPGAGRPNDPRWCSGRSTSPSPSRHTLPASVMPSIAWRSSGSAGATSLGRIGQRLPRRIDERSRPAKDGSPGRWATDCAKPLTIVGRSRSMRSRTPAASAAFEHTSRPPATSVPSRA